MAFLGTLYKYSHILQEVVEDGTAVFLKVEKSRLKKSTKSIYMYVTP